MTYNLQQIPNNPSRIDESISISKTGRLGLTRHFVTTQGIQDSMKAHLYLDADRQVIVVEVIEDNDPLAFPVRMVPDNNGAVISASAFFKAGRLDLDEYANRYPYVQQSAKSVGLDAKGGVFVIDLTKPIDARVAVA